MVLLTYFVTQVNDTMLVDSRKSLSRLVTRQQPTYIVFDLTASLSAKGGIALLC